MFRKLSCFMLIIAHMHGAPVAVQLSESPRIFMLRGFLSDKECNHMIKISNPNLLASEVVDENKTGQTISKSRTSRGFFISDDWKDPISIKIEKRIAKLTNMPIENGESLYVLCYEIGKEFMPHHDYFDPNTPGGAECLLRGGQRIATVIMYLNTPEEGGETLFPEANISIKPRKGDAVLFYNCTPEGMVDPNSLHAGSPVIAGEKWIMTKWIREREFN